ncbi:mannosyltransferase [Acidisoma cellulosilytica]|uniref:Mannosyltransferase n=1 Tax=Acidisoma cellulosilyticum TaxID=2802395 RepID=A0A964E551_9PROT|nr:mannosyltransferase [Acidisoma cellulosilyticum]MCB8881628.1 mannosyltransferase [Acidisoma cellulosilyticum]
MNRSLGSTLSGWVTAARSRLAPHPLLCCLAVALVPRLLAAFGLQTYYAADELYQYIEQAHRLVFHQGYVPWEFQVGLRSWLIPLVLAVPMEVARWLSPSPLFGLVLIRVLCSIGSLSVVWCAVRWGQLSQGHRGAWFAGLLAAVWPDFWMMAPHPLEDALAAYTLMPALYLAFLHRRSPSQARLLTSGFLLGMTFVLREQMAPAIAIIGIYLCARHLKNWIFAVGIALLPVIAAGMLDWFTWGEPFRSFWLDPYLNLVVGIARGSFGAASPVYYPLELLYVWLWGAIPLAWLAWRGAKNFPLAGWVALVIIAEHSLIAHKDFRFIFPAVVLLVPLAGIGLAGVWQTGKTSRNALIVILLLTGPYLSPSFFRLLGWQQSASGLYAELATHNPCLVAIASLDRGFWPIISVFGGPTQFTDATGAAYADAIVAHKGGIEIPAGFTLGACAQPSWAAFKPRGPEVCFWTRPASFCQPQHAAPFSLVYPPAARAYVIRDRLAPYP